MHFQVCYQSVSPQYVCILILQHQAKWMSFLSEQVTLIEQYCNVWKDMATFLR